MAGAAEASHTWWTGHTFPVCRVICDNWTAKVDIQKGSDKCHIEAFNMLGAVKVKYAETQGLLITFPVPSVDHPGFV